MSHSNETAHHLIPIKVYIGVWLALLIGTGLTIGAACLDLGFVNVPLMIGIACVKSTLVALFFMHLLYDEKFNLVVFLGGIVFVIIFFAFTLMDPLTRGWVNERDREMINPEMFRAGARVPHVYHISPGVPDMASTVTLTAEYAKQLETGSAHGSDGGHISAAGSEHGSAVGPTAAADSLSSESLPNAEAQVPHH